MQVDARTDLSDELGAVFGALSDPTRRYMLQSLMDNGSTSVPVLSAALPISRQAVAKHLAALEDARLIERSSDGGRVVSYRLRAGALHVAAAWMSDADALWGTRLERLKDVVERAPQDGH